MFSISVISACTTFMHVYLNINESGELVVYVGGVQKIFLYHNICKSVVLTIVYIFLGERKLNITLYYDKW